MMPLYLGIDGGQSGTTALIANETGEVVGIGRSGPCNHTGAPDRRAKFFRAVSESLAEAAAGAGLDAGALAFQAACLGFSGGAADKEQYSRELIRSAKFKITHDAEIALAGATGGKPGIIVIAGTGSIAFGRNQTGAMARAGGWGYVLGDEGGAFDLMRHALRAALQLEEHWGPSTALHAALLEATGSASADVLMRRFYAGEFPREQLASFAPVVDQAAEAGDRIARKILNRAGIELAHYAGGVHRQLFSEGDFPAISYVGGVFRSARLLATFTQRIGQSLGCATQPPLFIPAAGALLEAFRLDGIEPVLRGVPDSGK
ncbi:MAG: N-acetylglucosamine kinase [Bryobacteraceae bacterium]